jgi:hypothetical protein
LVKASPKHRRCIVGFETAVPKKRHRMPPR